MKNNCFKLLGAGLLSAFMSLACASANAGIYNFTQSGFGDGAVVTGFFQGQDINHDGKLVGDEVWAFHATNHGGLYDGVVFENSFHNTAWVSYTLGSGTLGNHADDAIYASHGNNIDYMVVGGEGRVADSWGVYPASISHTLVQVSEPSAVPEPETYAMMIAGLGLLGLMARRRNTAA